MIKILPRALAIGALSMLSVATAFAASRNSVDMLEYIPGDAPYAFVSLEPMPAKVANKLEPKFDEILQAYQQIMRHTVAEELAKMPTEGECAEAAEKLGGLADEVLDLMSIDGIRSLGFERDSSLALYGNGLLPVLRVELSDTDLFDKKVAQIEERADEALLIGEVNGESYKYAVVEHLKLIVATIDKQAVITVVPAAFDDAQLSLALGLKKPKSSLKKTKVLQKIGKEYDFSEYLTGYIDNQRIAAILLGESSGSDLETLKLMGYERPELDETCVSEIKGMVGIAPRLVFGYSEITTKQISSAMILEVREDIAKGLATLPATVPGLGIDAGKLMSAGFGISPMALREFFEARIDAMEKDPYECSLLGELQASVAKGREMLQQPFPPVAYSFRGLVASLDNLDTVAMAGDAGAESIDGTLLIAMENAEALVMMAAMMDPRIAALNLLPDGKPVSLSELVEMAGIAGDAYAALTANALSVSVGDGAEMDAAKMLEAGSAEPAPLFSLAMDLARYYAMIAEAIAAVPAEEGDDELSPEMRETMQDSMALYGKMFKRLLIGIHLTERGVEIGGTRQLAD